MGHGSCQKPSFDDVAVGMKRSCFHETNDGGVKCKGRRTLHASLTKDTLTGLQLVEGELG